MKRKLYYGYGVGVVETRERRCWELIRQCPVLCTVSTWYSSRVDSGIGSASRAQRPRRAAAGATTLHAGRPSTRTMLLLLRCAPPSQGMPQHHPSPVDRAGPGERALERDRRSLPVRARGAAQRLLETLCFERVRRSWHWQPARLRRAWQRSAAATGRQMLAGRPGRVTTLREG